MFIAASTRCFWDKSFDEACGCIADLEYDKIEIWLHENGDHLKPSAIAADPEAEAARLRDMTRLTPVALYLNHDVGGNEFSQIVQFAKLIKVAQITLDGAGLGTPFNTEIDRLRALCETAGRDGVRLSIRTESGSLTQDPHTAVELCQAVRGLGITLDPSHYLFGRREPVSYEIVYPHVLHVHLRDTSAEELQVQVGLGEIDYSRLINQLRHEAYTRALAVDLIPEKTNPETRQLEMRKLRLLLESLL